MPTFIKDVNSHNSAQSAQSKKWLSAYMYIEAKISEYS